MSWVLLSLRKSELKMLHSEYVAEDLRISRQQRQDARRYQYEQLLVRNDQQEELNELRSGWKDKRDGLYSSMKSVREQISQLDSDDPEYQTTKSELEKQYTELQTQLNQEKEEYEESVNNTKTYFEDNLAEIEEEANDVDTMHEEDKVTVETQMEAVAQELQAVTQAISQQIQNECISLK